MKRIITLLALFFVGCSAPTITSNYDKTVNFKEYKTFSFVTYTNTSKPIRADYDTPENRDMIRESIAQQLNEIGYSESSTKPDLSVVFEIIIKEMIDPRVDSAVIYKPWVDTKIDSYNYTEGLVVVRMIDQSKGQMVWQGSISGILNKDPKKLGKNADVYIRKLFSSLAEQLQ